MKTILAAVDFSPVTRRVVAEAMALARAMDGRLVLLNVTSPASLVRDHAAFESLIESRRPTLRRGASSPKVDAAHGDSLQIIGNPVDVIVEQARRCAADYVIVGSGRHTALFEAVVGGTAAGVIKGVTCPVVVVPARPRRSRANRLPPWGRLARAAPRSKRAFGRGASRKAVEKRKRVRAT